MAARPATCCRASAGAPVPALRAPLGVEDRTAERPRLRADVRRRPARAGHAGGARAARRRGRARRRSSSSASRSSATRRWPREIVAAGHAIGAALPPPPQPAAPGAAAGARRTSTARRRRSRTRPAARRRSTGRPTACSTRPRCAWPTRAAGARCCGATGGATGRRAPRPSRSPRASPRAPARARCCCCTTPTTTPRRARGGARSRRCRGCSRRSPSAACEPVARLSAPRALPATTTGARARRVTSIACPAPFRSTPRRLAGRRARSARAARASARARAGGSRLLAIGWLLLAVRRDHQPRAAAPVRRARATPRHPARRARAAHRPRARARPLAGRPPHARAGRSPTTTTTRTSSSRSALLGWLWWRRADIYRPLRNSLVLVNVIGFVVFWLLPGRAAADARRLHRRGRLHARVRLLAHRRARLARQPARGDALAAHGLGGVVHARAVARSAERPVVRALARRLSVRDGVRGARDGQPLRAGHRRRRWPRWRSRSLLVGSPRRAWRRARLRARARRAARRRAATALAAPRRSA